MLSVLVIDRSNDTLSKLGRRVGELVRGRSDFGHSRLSAVVCFGRYHWQLTDGIYVYSKCWHDE